MIILTTAYPVSSLPLPEGSIARILPVYSAVISPTFIGGYILSPLIATQGRSLYTLSSRGPHCNLRGAVSGSMGITIRSRTFRGNFSVSLREVDSMNCMAKPALP